MEGVSSPEWFFGHIFTSASLETSSPVCPSVLDPAECCGAHQPGFSHRVTVKYKVNNTAGGSYLSHWLGLLSFLHRADNWAGAHCTRQFTSFSGYFHVLMSCQVRCVGAFTTKTTRKQIHPEFTLTVLFWSTWFRVICWPVYPSVTAKTCLRVFVCLLCALPQSCAASSFMIASFMIQLNNYFCQYSVYSTFCLLGEHVTCHISMRKQAEMHEHVFEVWLIWMFVIWW